MPISPVGMPSTQLTPITPHASEPLTPRSPLETPTKLDTLRSAPKSLESENKLDNFEIQNLMSDLNQAETLSSSVLKKLADTASSIIGKI